MDRLLFLDRISKLRSYHPIVALLGPRQCGKTTLARQFADNYEGKIHYYDLEDPADLLIFDNPKLALESLEGLIIIDEIQRTPELFPILRVLVDKPNTKQSFLILGSASKELLKQSSESLAGRIAYLELTPFNFNETKELSNLWLRGGYPKSYLAPDEENSLEWRNFYISTYLEQDLPNLGVRIPAPTLRRFWSMLAHYHGNIVNFSEIGKSFGAADTTIRKYVDILASTFMVRQLQPWVENNLKKRQVKAPKVYFRDSGLLHSLLLIESKEQLIRHPKMGASWEGFALEEVIRGLQAKPYDCFFWGTHSGAELDLLIKHKGKRLGFEFKYSDAPKRTKSMVNACEDLSLDKLTVIYPGEKSVQIDEKIVVIGLEEFLSSLS